MLVNQFCCYVLFPGVFFSLFARSGIRTLCSVGTRRRLVQFLWLVRGSVFRPTSLFKDLGGPACVAFFGTGLCSVYGFGGDLNGMCRVGVSSGFGGMIS